MVKGKKKGNVNEREVAKTLTEWWCDVPRKEKHLWRADMVCGGVPEFPGDIAQQASCRHEQFPFSVECKSRKDEKYFKNLLVEDNDSLILEAWDKLEEQTEDHNEKTGQELIPLLVFTKNYYPDFVMHNRTKFCLSNPVFMYEREVGAQSVFYINLLDRFLNDRLREEFNNG